MVKIIKSGKNKKGFFFSLDSFMGLILFILTLALVYTFFIATHSLQQEFFISEDLLNTFSNVKIGDLDNIRYTGINCLIGKNKIDDTNLSIIEGISILYDKDKDAVKYFLTDITYQNPSSSEIKYAGCPNLPTDKGLIPIQYDIDISILSDQSTIFDKKNEKAPSILSRQRLISKPQTTTTQPPPPP